MYKILTTIFIACAVFIAQPAKAEIRIDVTRGVVEPLPIAVPEFEALGGATPEMARNIQEVIQNNLLHTNLFRMVETANVVRPQEVNADKPNFPIWQNLNAQTLVAGRISFDADQQLVVEFRIWDILAKQELQGMRYRTPVDNWRRISHKISDDIYERLTGESGYFDSRVVYVSESYRNNQRIKRLAIMDQDGANHKYLTDGSYLVLTPRFAPKEPVITYLSYESGVPRVYLYNLQEGTRKMLGEFPGMTFAPRFSPNGDELILSFAQDGNSDIYILDLKRERMSRLTRGSEIDTSPSFSPDADRVAFESDRGGSQQIYVMDHDGSDARRITFGQGRYANPVWSPRGDLIAFTKMLSGEFYIGVIKPDGSGERLLAKAYHAEGPTWSPNGRVLMYFKEKVTGSQGFGREAKIYTIDITGYNERLVVTPSGASDPAWSGLNE